jgi:penicillin amidase
MSERVSKHSPKKLLQPGLGTGAALLLLLGMIFYGFFDRPDVFSGGEARLDCLSENVEIYFDEYSIKHINAANLPDLFRAVGYLHASTHLAEMDRLLRVATGQMAAARGEKFIDLDVAARRLGFSAKARQIQPQLSTPAKVVLEAYCEGVNAFIATQKRSVAQSFRLSGYQPLHWEPAGCLAILQLQQWAYSCSWDEKIVVYMTSEVFGSERTAAGFPSLSNTQVLPHSEHKDAFFDALTRLYREGVELRRAIALCPGREEALVWAIADPNLPYERALLGFESNYLDPAELLLDLLTPELQLYGLFTAGMPIALAGCNCESAWGYNRCVDENIDLLVFPVAPAREQYLAADGWKEITRRTEQIEIRHKADRAMTFYQIDQNVVLDFPAAAADSVINVLTVAWRGVTADEVNGRIAVMLSRDPVENAISDSAPAGLIFASPSSIIKNEDVRPYNSSTENLPVDFSGDDSLSAHSFNVRPTKGLFYPGNQADRMLAFARQADLTSLPSVAERLRINTLETDKYFRKIVAAARYSLCDSLFTRTAEFEASRALLTWDGSYRGSSMGATVYRTFTDNLLRNVYADELYLVTRETFRQFAAANDFALRNLTSLLEKGESSWFDDLHTPEKTEWQGEIIRQSFHEAVQQLEKSYSANLSEWQWGRVWQDFQIDRPQRHQRSGKDRQSSRTLIMQAAGSQSEIYCSSFNPECGVRPANLYRHRFDVIRDCRQIIVLNSEPSR